MTNDSGGQSHSYRAQFASRERVIEYETKQYGLGSYGDVLWRIEQTQLRALIEEFRRTHRNIDYLDFAAGTGRIISYMEDMVDTATGVEISEPMAERARRKVKNAQIMRCDITRQHARVEATYDFITAFRFLLNAEPSLRRAALQALAARLRDKTSLLVFNNHSYVWSYRLLAYPVYLARKLIGSECKIRYLSHRQVFQLAEEAGLRIDRIIGYGLLSGQVSRMVPIDQAVKWEEMLAKNPLLSRMGVNQIYVARLR